MVRHQGFDRLTDIDEALSIFLGRIKLERLEGVKVPLRRAFGRITAENVVADCDLPAVDRSAMDGYAVRAQDTFPASQSCPKILKLIRQKRIGENEAVQVWTGSMLPRGTNAVVMLEYTKPFKDGIAVLKPVTPGENVARRGEDVKKGTVAIKGGTRLKPHHIGLLAALGAPKIMVTEKPKVAILSTGNEVVEVGHKSKMNQVVDVNRLILSCMCLEVGAEPLDLGIANDDRKEISAKIQTGIERTHALITTGGTSVGARDMVPKAVNQVATPGVIVHGIAMRPGMPTALAIHHEKPIFIFSGNPVASMIGFEVFARPVLFRFLGVENERRPVVRSRLTRRVASALGRQVFLRVHVVEREGEYLADPIRIKGSGVLTTMTKANGYVIIPKDSEGLEKGENVLVHLFDTLRR